MDILITDSEEDQNEYQTCSKGICNHWNYGLNLCIYFMQEQLPPPIPGVTIPDSWTVTIINDTNPETSVNKISYTRTQFQSFTIPEAPLCEGYELKSYNGSDGQRYHPGDVLSYSDDGLVLRAVWNSIITVDPADATPLASAIAEGTDIIVMPANLTTEESITIPEGRSIEIRGEGEERKKIKANFTLDEGSSLTARNIQVSSDIASAKLISSTASNVSVSLINSELTVSSDGRGIQLAPSDTIAANLKISLTDSTISSDSSGAIGIFLNGPKSSWDNISATVKLTNSNIICSDVSGSNNHSIVFQRVGKLNAAINGGELSTEKNHYAIYMNACGSDDAESKIDISNTKIKGYADIYINSASGISRNIAVSLKNCDLTSINQNSGTSDGFGAIVIEGGIGCSIAMDGGSINYGPTSKEAEQKLFRISPYLYNGGTTGGTGNNIDFFGCDINYSGADLSQGVLLGIVRQIEENTNSYSFDQSSLNSLAALVENGTITENKISDDGYEIRYSAQ